VVAESAPGKAARATASPPPLLLLPKQLLAKTTANAEFCIPTSIERVRQFCSEYRPNALGMKYPKPKPKECNTTTALQIRHSRDSDNAPAPAPFDKRSVVRLLATTPPQIKLTNKTERKGVNRDTVRDAVGKIWFHAMPNMTGTNTTRAVAPIKAVAEM
jgi:hypothetical protein